MRPLAEILLELDEVRRDWEAALKNAETAEREGNPNLEAQFGDRMSDLDNKQDGLRVEFRARFKELTGVSWSNVDAAIVSGAL